MGGEWPKDWRRRRLGEVADVNWGDTTTTKASYTEVGFPAFSASGPDGYLPYANFNRTGIVLSAIGADCGKTWLAKGKWSCIKNTIRFWATDPDVDTEFLYWLTRDPSFWPKRGSAQPFISQGDARAVEIAYPPLPEQRAIAHILGTLDDKIELNRRMSETLEAMARALFKSWFVDFDPVRAKMEGRWRKGESLPGLPAHLYDLFPDQLVDSELGEIPEGWRVASLPDLIEINPPRPLRKGEIAPYLDMANMPTRGHAPDEVVDRSFGSGMRFINGDTLVARITPCLENGKTAFVDFLRDGQVGWGSTEYIVLCPKPPLPEEFAYCLARSDAFREFAIQSMTGTSGRQRVQADSLEHFRLPRVPAPLAEAFGRAIKPLFVRSSAAVRESRTLAALRDALLPKLIRGEIRVKDAEGFLERTDI
ncbi:MAG TPA: restriction endonuclease subunit S [Fimbriimonadales bacterium]|nr:restriction endonuclease subunit S [Fimbriimonadales bacterium]